MADLIEKLEILQKFYADKFLATKGHDYGTAVSVMQKVINTVKSHNDWMPCSEPPKNDKDVLLWLKRQGGQMIGFYSKNGEWRDENGGLITPAILSLWHELPQSPSEI